MGNESPKRRFPIELKMNKWSDNEVATLKLRYEHSTNQELADIFPDKSAVAIYKKARKLGLSRDKNVAFKNRSLCQKGKKSSNWKGGRKKTSKGYIQVMSPNHPRADSGGYVLEHILVFERETGISVPRGCCVHHLNGNKEDNRIENLCIMTVGAHTVMHHSGTKQNERTKALISSKAKERFSDKRNHPSYKEIDLSGIQSLVDSGYSVNEACKIAGIAKSTYYRKGRDNDAE